MLSEKEYDALYMKSLNTTSKGRAKIAAKLILDGTWRDEDECARIFDNCFEMGDADKVLKHLASLVMKDKELASVLYDSGNEIFNRSTAEELFKACESSLGIAFR